MSVSELFFRHSIQKVEGHSTHLEYDVDFSKIKKWGEKNPNLGTEFYPKRVTVLVSVNVKKKGHFDFKLYIDIGYMTIT